MSRGPALPMAVVAVVVGAALLVACAEKEPAAAPSPPAAAPAAAEPSTANVAPGRVARGEVRGEVVSLPAPDEGNPMLGIRHEDIAIATDEGEPWEMGSMTMPFSLADDVALDGVAVGDKIAFTLEVALDDGMAMAVTELRALAPDATLTWDAEGGEQAAEAAGHDGH